MIRPEQIEEILSLYRKYGWTLRRVLLSEELKAGLGGNLEDLFGEVEISPSDIDAAWFSRSARENQETWELRRLSENPYALLQVFDADDDEEIREEARRDVEARMKEA